MRSLIIGRGEIGSSLHKVLQEKHESYIRDKEPLKKEGIEVLNICYPYSKDFVKNTKAYIKEYSPKVTIIHSTVPPGTTREIGREVVHSPIHGKHPNLATGIKTFVKYVGGTQSKAIKTAKDFLLEAGIKAVRVASPETSELSKVLCTSQYGWNIVLMKEIYALCKKYKVPFSEVYIQWNTHYNEGYEKLGSPQYKRPILIYKPGKIGGHCVVNNTKLLKSFITDTIKRKDKTY